jgi:hypothetical protein
LLQVFAETLHPIQALFHSKMSPHQQQGQQQQQQQQQCMANLSTNGPQLIHHSISHSISLENTKMYTAKGHYPFTKLIMFSKIKKNNNALGLL